MFQIDKYEAALRYAMEALREWKDFPLVSAVYLFGSVARQETVPGSDVDIYVLTSQELSKKQVRQLKEICRPDDADLPDVDVKTEAVWKAEENNDLFHRNIREDGILLWQRKRDTSSMQKMISDS